MINFNNEETLKNSSKRKMMYCFGMTAILLSFICSILGIFIQIKSPDVIIDIIIASFSASGFCSATVAAEYFSGKVNNKNSDKS